jgi:uncharacterized protein YegL
MSLVEFANKLISLVFVGVHADPIMCEGLVVRLIEMQESAVSLLPSNSFLDLVQIPGIVQSSAASLRSVLENLKKWITEDITNLKQQGHRVCRPLVFVFLGRSDYNDDWQVLHRELTDRTLFNFAPNIFCFGTADVEPRVIREIASVGDDELKHMAAYVMDSSVGVDILAKSVWQEYISRAIWSPFQARTVDSPAINFPSLAPGISPVLVESPDVIEAQVKRFPVPAVQNLPLVASGSETGAQVIPIYFVCDESYSAVGDATDFVNAEISELFRLIASDPIIDEKARVGIVFFAETASISLPLSKISEVHQVLGCVADGVSAYAPVFRLLKSQIEADVSQLQTEGFEVRRPFVFFITHGRPLDKNWRRELAKLVDSKFHYRPHILSFGLAGADPAVIKEVSTPLTVGGMTKESLAFLADDGATPSMALVEIFKFTINS